MLFFSSFLGQNWAKFSLLSHFLRVMKSCCFPTLANEMRTQKCAKENATEMRVLFFKREGEKTARVFVVVVSRQSRFVAENVFCSSRLLLNFIRGAASGFREAKPSSSRKRNSRYITFFFVCVKLFSLPSKTTEKEMGKTSVKPERETVASEDARESER